MKQELPIAILLLAAGGLVFYWQSRRPRSAPIPPPSVQRASEMTLHPVRPPSPIVQQVGTSRSVQPAYPSPNIPSPRQISDYNTPSQFLVDLGRQLEAGVPFRTDFQIEAKLHRQSFTVAGRYQQIGQGTRKSRTELLIGGSTSPTKLIRVSDGRFLYTQLENASESTLDFVDMQRLETNAPGSAQKPSELARAWMSPSGLPHLFESLGLVFEFRVLSPQSGSSAPLVLEGEWNPEKLRALLKGTVDERYLSPTIDWGHLPPQLPHGVRIELVESPGVGLFPRTITFFKFSTSTGKKKNDLLSHLVSSKVTPLATIRFSQPQSQSIAPETVLRLDSQGIPPRDITDRYADQIREFQAARRASLPAGRR